MKIAFFHNLPLSGAKKVVYEQIDYLSSKNLVDLYQLLPEDDFFSFKKVTRQTYTYQFTQYNRLPFFLSRIVRDYKNFITLKYLHKKIAQDIDNRGYDMVIVHPDKYTQAPFLLKFLKTKNIYYCHEWLRIVYESEFRFNEDVSIFKKWYEFVTREIRKYIDTKNVLAAKYIITNSLYTAKNCEKAYGIKTRVCYPGVDIHQFKNTNIKKEYDILFVGDKTNNEGMKILTKVKELTEKNLSIKIISKKRSNFTLSEYNLMQEYCKARIVLCLSIREPFGLIPLEAMACGVPVIAVNEGGYKETIIDGKTGYLIPRDPKTLTEKIELLLSSPHLLSEMSKNARIHIKKNWTWEKNGKRLEELIHKFMTYD